MAVRWQASFSYPLGRLSRHSGGPPLTLRLPPKAPRAPEIGLALPSGCCYHAAMNERKNEGNDEGSSGWVNTDVAAEALGVSARSVRNYILDGALVARKEKEGINKRYVVSVDSLHALRDRRKQKGKLQARRRRASRQSEAPGKDAAEMVRETAVDMLRETLSNLEMHMAQNAELRARLELTERAESTLREEPERLREELEAERSKGFWARLFGG